MSSAAAVPTQSASVERSIGRLPQRDVFGLPINRFMLGMFVDDDGRHHAFGRDARAVFDYVRWRRRLDDGALAAAAAIFETVDDNDAVLGRDRVETFRALVAHDLS